jgi:hypothetical protein
MAMRTSETGVSRAESPQSGFTFSSLDSIPANEATERAVDRRLGPTGEHHLKIPHPKEAGSLDLVITVLKVRG